MRITSAARTAALTALLITLPAGAAVAGGHGWGDGHGPDQGWSTNGGHGWGPGKGGGGHGGPSDPVVLAENLVGPLHVAAGVRGVAVSQSFAGQVTLVGRNGATPVYTAPSPDWDVAGLDWKGSTLYVLTSTGAGQGDPALLAGSLLAIDRDGTVTTVTDQLSALETATNPDAGLTYGLAADVAAANPGCVAELGALGVPASYTGQLDAHPYGLAIDGKHAYVADAGANSVIDVNLRTGEVSTLAVLPPQPVTLTDEQAAGLGVPSCAGLTYSFEAVPTDVAVGRHGTLYVSTLPGGPEGPELGARGSVYTIDRHGTVSQYVTGILSPTGIDVDERGRLYVASLFGDGVLRFGHQGSGPTVVLPASQAADVDVTGGTLYATTDALGGAGQLVKVRR